MIALTIITWALSGLLAAMMLMAGSMKLLKKHADIPMPTLQDRSPATVKLIGAAEVLGAVAIIVPPLVGIAPWLAVAGGVGLAVIQFLAIFAHRRHSEPFHMNVILMIVALAVAALWAVLL